MNTDWLTDCKNVLLWWLELGSDYIDWQSDRTADIKLQLWPLKNYLLDITAWLQMQDFPRLECDKWNWPGLLLICLVVVDNESSMRVYV